MQLAFVDLETTGATATADRITEIGIVEVDEEGVREWSSLVNPGTRIPEFIERLTGISNAMVAGAPVFEDLADEVLARLSGRLFIAHNARFDYGFLRNEFRRAGFDFRPTVLCTVKLSRRLFPQHHHHNLDSLIARHGLAVNGRHRALADARLIHQFWNHVHGSVDPETLQQVLRDLTARPSLPPHLDPALLDALPDGPGVYLFYGDNELPLYVGKSTEIRNRVLSHFAADHTSSKEMSLSQQVKRIDWIETAGEIGALLKEAALIKQLQPIHNRRLRRNSEVCAWRLVEYAQGLWKPDLVSAEEIGFGWQEGLFGMFKHPRDAQKLLRGVCEEHGLCPALLGLEKVGPGKPCFAHQVQKCRGACVGKESAAHHSGRLMAALGKFRLKAWPHPGPACIREGEAVHLLDAWRYLGTARSDEELWELLESPRPAFDGDIYRILAKVARHLVPLPAAASRTSANAAASPG